MQTTPDNAKMARSEIVVNRRTGEIVKARTPGTTIEMAEDFAYIYVPRVIAVASETESRLKNEPTVDEAFALLLGDVVNGVGTLVAMLNSMDMVERTRVLRGIVPQHNLPVTAMVQAVRTCLDIINQRSMSLGVIPGMQEWGQARHYVRQSANVLDNQDVVEGLRQFRKAERKRNEQEG